MPSLGMPRVSGPDGGPRKDGQGEEGLWWAGVPDAPVCPQNCLFDTCNCEKSEDCMCAALSSYVWACAARGVLLRGWRDGVCSECPPAG